MDKTCIIIKNKQAKIKGTYSQKNDGLPWAAVWLHVRSCFFWDIPIRWLEPGSYCLIIQYKPSKHYARSLTQPRSLTSRELWKIFIEIHNRKKTHKLLKRQCFSTRITFKSLFPSFSDTESEWNDSDCRSPTRLVNRGLKSRLCIFISRKSMIYFMTPLNNLKNISVHTW